MPCIYEFIYFSSYYLLSFVISSLTSHVYLSAFTEPESRQNPDMNH